MGLGELRAEGLVGKKEAMGLFQAPSASAACGGISGSGVGLSQ